MVRAYNAGLSIRELSKLWHTFSYGGIHSRLTNSGVAMRPAAAHAGPTEAVMLDFYRQVAERELPQLTKNPAKSASPGMIAAYNAGLSIRIVSSLWNGLALAVVHNRLRVAGVRMRSAAEAGRKGPPSTQLVDHYRSVARRELCNGVQHECFARPQQGQIQWHAIDRARAVMPRS